MVNDSDLQAAQRMLGEAREDMAKGAYPDADSGARAALDDFLLIRDENGFDQRTYEGIQEAAVLIIDIRRRWSESGTLPSVETIETLRKSVVMEVDALHREMRIAVRDAIHGCGTANPKVT